MKNARFIIFIYTCHHDQPHKCCNAAVASFPSSMAKSTLPMLGRWARLLSSSWALTAANLWLFYALSAYRPIGHTTNVYTMPWHGALHYISRRSLRSRLSPTLRYFHLMPMMPNKFRIQTTRSRSLYIDFSEIDAYLRSASFSHIHARWKSASRPNSQPNALIVPQAWHSHWSLNPQPRAVTRSSLVTWDHTWLHAPFLAQHHWHCRNFNARLTEWLQNGSKWGMNKGTLAILGWQSSVYIHALFNRWEETC